MALVGVSPCWRPCLGPACHFPLLRLAICERLMIQDCLAVGHADNSTFGEPRATTCQGLSTVGIDDLLWQGCPLLVGRSYSLLLLGIRAAELVDGRSSTLSSDQTRNASVHVIKASQPPRKEKQSGHSTYHIGGSWCCLRVIFTQQIAGQVSCTSGHVGSTIPAS